MKNTYKQQSINRRENNHVYYKVCKSTYAFAIPSIEKRLVSAGKLWGILVQNMSFLVLMPMRMLTCSLLNHVSDHFCSHQRQTTTFRLSRLVWLLLDIDMFAYF